MKLSKWDRRIRRAEELATTHPFASEVLQFYKHLAGLQKAIYLGVEQAHGWNQRNSTASLLGCQLDADLLMPKFHEFLSNLEAGRSQPIAQSAKDLNSQHAGRCRDLFRQREQCSRVSPQHRGASDRQEHKLFRICDTSEVLYRIKGIPKFWRAVLTTTPRSPFLTAGSTRSTISVRPYSKFK